MGKPSKPIDIYTRVSRVGGREHLVSHEDQEAQARGFLKARGLPVGRVLSDEDVSGGTLDRPGLEEALRRVESAESGGMVVAYLSRASRDTRQGLDLLERVTLAGGAVYAPNLPDYTTADSRMLTTIQLAIDAGYRERKREEFERAKAGAIARGVPVNTRAAVGLRKRKDGTLEIVTRVAEVVREVFERRACGAGPTELAELLERNRIRTSQGSRTWSKQAVYGLLKNPIYKGVLQYGGRYINESAVPAIVDAATWQAAQHPNGRRLGRVSEKSAWLLAGLLRCAACRYVMQGTTTSRSKRIYRCTVRHAGGICPAPARIDADRIEEAAVAAFWRVTADLEARATRDHHADLAKLEDALRRADERVAQLRAPEAQDALGEQYLNVFRERREERERAAAELGAARAAVSDADEVIDSETLRGAWDRMTIAERRQVIGLRLDAIALRRDPVAIVVYPAGTAPADLPRRGFKAGPVLASFPDPPRGARAVTL